MILPHAPQLGRRDGVVGVGGGEDHPLPLDEPDAPEVVEREGVLAQREPIPVEGHGARGERRQAVVVLPPVQGLTLVGEGRFLAQRLRQLFHLRLLPFIPVEGRPERQVIALEEAKFIDGHTEPAVAVEPVPLAVERVDPVAPGAQVQGRLQGLRQRLPLKGDRALRLGLVGVSYIIRTYSQK